MVATLVFGTEDVDEEARTGGGESFVRSIMRGCSGEISKLKNVAEFRKKNKQKFQGSRF